DGPQDAGYWNDWLTNLAPPTSCGGTTCMDYFALDVYPPTWDATLYGTAGGAFLCGRNSATTSSPCLSTTVLTACSPSPNDTAGDCQWFVPSNTTIPSGEVLESVTGSVTGTGSGACTYNVTGGGTNANGAVLKISW